MATKSSHEDPRGGAREGAGRPANSGPFQQPTRPVRIPESHIPNVLAYLDAVRQEAKATDPRSLAIDAPPVPLTAYLSKVPAGFPSPAEEYSEDLDLSRHLIIQGHAEATFILRVTGHSMTPCACDGDEVLVDRALTAKEGSVVIAVINGEMAIKRLMFEKGLPILRSDNPRFADRRFSDGEELQIWGVVTRVLHRV